MVHCWPLPGAPGYTGCGTERTLKEALRNAEALAGGGWDGLIVENRWELPFRAGSHVQPESIATQAVVVQAVVVQAVRERVGLPIGVNRVHNGA
jgi:predicted TIM-barrel enzyme